MYTCVSHLHLPVGSILLGQYLLFIFAVSAEFWIKLDSVDLVSWHKLIYYSGKCIIHIELNSKLKQKSIEFPWSGMANLAFFIKKLFVSIMCHQYFSFLVHILSMLMMILASFLFWHMKKENCSFSNLIWFRAFF